MSQKGRRGRPRNQDREEIDARLIAVAAELFFAKGYGHATMTAVAATARVSNTTLYARFPTKAELFRAVLTAEIARWGSGDLRVPIDQDLDMEGLLTAYGAIVIRAGLSARFIQLNRLLYSESGRFQELSDIAGARMAIGVDWLTEELAQRSGRVEASPTRFRTIARLFLCVLSGWLGQCVLGDRNPSEQERQEWLQQSVAMVMAYVGEDMPV